jgi:hypothetical protein
MEAGICGEKIASFGEGFLSMPVSDGCLAGAWALTFGAAFFVWAVASAFTTGFFFAGPWALTVFFTGLASVFGTAAFFTLAEVFWAFWVLSSFSVAGFFLVVDLIKLFFPMKNPFKIQ